MKVILTQNVPSIGKRGDMVKVSDGYARNFLFPRGLALEATDRHLATLAQEQAQTRQKVEKEKKSAQTLAETLGGLTVTIARRVGEQDRLYGSVTPKDIEKALQDQGLPIDRKHIVLPEPLKTPGTFPVKIKLGAGLSAEILVAVVAGE